MRKRNHQQMLLGLACVSALLLGACKASGEIEKTPDGGMKATFSGEVDPFSGSKADGTVMALGHGTVTLEDGTTLEGDFYDTDGDGSPDKFKPDEGQSSSSGNYGTTNGTDWFDLDIDSISTQSKKTGGGKSKA